VETAAKLRMELLSAKHALILSWVFAGETSPWTNPILSGPSGARMFKGTTYNIYHIEWSAAKQWQGGPPGRVPGSKTFHVGAIFSSVSQTDPEAIIIADVKLLDASNSPLSQRPQWLGFDAGTLDSGTGDLNLRFFNLSDRPLILRDVVVQDLPRVMSINAMVRNPRIDDPVHDISDKPDRAFMRWDFEDKIGEVKKGAIRRPLL